MIEIVVLLLVGVLSSLCGAVVGLGGGFIIVPFLAFAYDMPVSEIVGTSLAVLVFGSLSSTIAYVKQRRIDMKSGTLFAVAMIPGSVLGAFTANIVSNRGFFVALRFSTMHGDISTEKTAKITKFITEAYGYSSIQ